MPDHDVGAVDVAVAGAAAPVAAIRYYYSNREDLLSAALARIEESRHEEAEAAASGGDASRAEIVRRLLHTYMGRQLDDRTLKSMIGWMVDAPRESPRLAAELANLWPGIEVDIADTNSACGLPKQWAPICAHAIDGAILAGVAGGHDRLEERAIRALEDILDLAHIRPSAEA